jgi:hypothetical protein
MATDLALMPAGDYVVASLNNILKKADWEELCLTTFGYKDVLMDDCQSYAEPLTEGCWTLSSGLNVALMFASKRSWTVDSEDQNYYVRRAHIGAVLLSDLLTESVSSNAHIRIISNGTGNLCPYVLNNNVYEWDGVQFGRLHTASTTWVPSRSKWTINMCGDLNVTTNSA